MAIFKPVLSEILRVEGGLADDPDDRGGLTWQGVAINSHPNWPGFKIVKRIIALNPKSYALFKKGEPDKMNAALYAQKDLAVMVAEFYEALYWDVNRLDEILDQQLARNVCDHGVNCGTRVAAKMLQRALNNSYGRTVLKDDGIIGRGTLTVVNNGQAQAIYNEFNILRKAYYDAIIARSPSQAKFRRSWYSRIIPYKT